MPNRILTDKERKQANALLEIIRKRLAKLADNDRELLFAYRRKIAKQLVYDERGTPMQRRKLKILKRKEQKGLCAMCSKPLPEKYVDLDRRSAMLGYTVENTRLVHHDCHHLDQAERKYS